MYNRIIDRKKTEVNLITPVFYIQIIADLVKYKKWLSVEN